MTLNTGSNDAGIHYRNNYIKNIKIENSNCNSVSLFYCFYSILIK